MLKTILRKEHKNQWEKRVAISPAIAQQLQNNGYPLAIESSLKRIYSDQQYQDHQIDIVTSPDGFQLILGIKEPPVNSIQKQQIHLCFSHTIKGQKYNMPLLQRFIDQRATLIDYELMKNEQGARTIAFGRFAGIAGTIDTLWLYGQLLQIDNTRSILSALQQTWQYGSVANAEAIIRKMKITADQQPLRVIILGNGRVGRGCKEVCEWLGLTEISSNAIAGGDYDNQRHWFSVLGTSEIYQHNDGDPFDKDDYYLFGKKKYHSRFKDLLGHCDVVLMTSFWTDTYPRHMEMQDFSDYAQSLPRILGDISCDVGGAFACTTKITDIDNPVFTFNPEDYSLRDGLHAHGLAVMAVDNLPSELSQDASDHFSRVLAKHMPSLMTLDLNQDYQSLSLDNEIKNAIIVYNGELTPDFQYLQKYL